MSHSINSCLIHPDIPLKQHYKEYLFDIQVARFSNRDGHLDLDSSEDEDDYCSGRHGSRSWGDQTKLVYLAISLLTPLGRVEPQYLTFLIFNNAFRHSKYSFLHYTSEIYISAITPLGNPQ